jgi:MFS family permease
MLQKLNHQYQGLGRASIYLIACQFFIQLVNTSFLTILNLLMLEHGYTDVQIAGHIAYRFLVVIPFAFPLGIFVKGRRLKPLIIASGLGTTLFSYLRVYTITHHYTSLISLALIGWGLSFTIIQVLAIPFLLRHTPSHLQAEAIALSYANYSFGMIASGGIIFILNSLSSSIFTEEVLLYLLTSIGLLSVWFALRFPTPEHIPSFYGKRWQLWRYNWKKISLSLTPTLIIAIGSGLAIPFMNIFFYQIFNLTTQDFALINGISFVLVACCTLLIPFFKKLFGFKNLMVGAQAIAIVALFSMGIASLYNHLLWCLGLSVFLFLIRQPLMNLAAPLTTEIMMQYVGKRNQEMASALMASVWAGSWYFSSIFFKWFRAYNINYAYIFGATAVLYALGVYGYYLLMRTTKLALPDHQNS